MKELIQILTFQEKEGRSSRWNASQLEQLLEKTYKPSIAFRQPDFGIDVDHAIVECVNVDFEMAFLVERRPQCFE